MTRNDPHALRPLPPTDPASAPSATAVVADDANDANGANGAPTTAGEPASDAAAADADDARVSLAMRVLAWLPLRLWTDCGVCLFWRGAVVGALAAGALATVVSPLL